MGKLFMDISTNKTKMDSQILDLSIKFNLMMEEDVEESSDKNIDKIFSLKQNLKSVKDQLKRKVSERNKYAKQVKIP
jgi:hypothetical protein